MLSCDAYIVHAQIPLFKHTWHSAIKVIEYCVYICDCLVSAVLVKHEIPSQPCHKLGQNTPRSMPFAYALYIPKAKGHKQMTTHVVHVPQP